MRLTRHRFTVLGLLIAIALVGLCVSVLSTGVQVTVTNLGPDPSSDAVVHVTGNAHPIGRLDVGASRTVRVRPRGESHVEIGFTDPQGKRSRLVVDCYFETNHYRGAIAVEIESGAIRRVDDRVRSSLY